MVSWADRRARRDRSRAELRDPQERPEVRRGPEPPAPGDLRRAASGGGGPRGRGAPGLDEDVIRVQSANHTAEDIRRSGSSSACGTQLETLYPVGGIPGARPAGAPPGAQELARLVLAEDDARRPDDKLRGTHGPVAPNSSGRSSSDVLDRRWREHLYEMDYLQGGHRPAGDGPARSSGRVPEGGLRPLVAMMSGIREETVGYMFHVQPTVGATRRSPRSRSRRREAAEAPAHIVAPASSRSDPDRCSTPRRPSTRMYRPTWSAAPRRWQRRDTDPRFQNVSQRPLPVRLGQKFKRCGDPRNAA